MSDKEKNIPQEEESFEDIFSSLREKYNLEPFGNDEKPAEEEEKVFYNPSEDNEIDDFFKEAEESYNALYEEVDAKIAGVDDEVLRHEAEVFNLEFNEEQQIPIEKSQEESQEFEDVYSNSDAEKEDEETSAAVIGGAAEPAEIYAENSSEEEEIFEEEPKKKKSSIFPQKGDSTGEVIRKIVFLISIIALLGSAAWLVNDYFIQPYLISKQNSEVSNLIADDDVAPEAVVEKLSNLNEEEKTVTFASLKEANKDFKAWLVVPGANISLPVVQTSNNDKYLNTGFNGKYLSGGTAFLDYLNKAPFSDTNTVIYGHNMRDGSMFGSIKKYRSIDAFKKNPLVYVYTENENYVYKIFSVFLTNASKDEDNGYVFGYTFKNLSTDENFVSFMEEIKLRSYYNTGVDYQAGDKIITLSTCDKTVLRDGRLVLIARLVRENEDEAVDTSKATYNSKQKFPAGWYDKKKQKNPYENAVRWVAQ